jgi:hypothetical protein
MLGDIGRKCQRCWCKMGTVDCAEFGGRCYDVQVIESGAGAMAPDAIARTCEKCPYGKCTKLWRSQVESWKGSTSTRRACIAAVDCCLDVNECGPWQVNLCMHVFTWGRYPCQAIGELPIGEGVTGPQAM